MSISGRLAAAIGDLSIGGQIAPCLVGVHASGAQLQQKLRPTRQ